MSRPKISVAMIARDEEIYLYDCLSSVADIADEIVLVDTGSADRTAAIAAFLGARVYYKDWNNDYAAARNYGLSYCTGDWIFQIDPDERLRPVSVPLLLAAVKRPNLLRCNISVHNEGRPDPEPDQVPRLFRNLPGVEYWRVYHETVCASLAKIEGREPGKWTCDYIPGIVLDHVGHARRNQDDMTQKTLRAIYLMEKWMRENPGDYYIAAKLAVCYSMIQRAHPKVMRDIRANQGNILLHEIKDKQSAWAAFAGALAWDIEYRKQLQALKEKKRSGHNHTVLQAVK